VGVFMDKLENGTKVYFIPQLDPKLDDVCFDLLYDRYISSTNTSQIIENISIENLETFLYQTAKIFYGKKPKVTGGQ